MTTPAQIGQWANAFDLDNVAIHVTLLPTGKILYWGRRLDPFNQVSGSMNVTNTKAFLFDPSTGKSSPTNTQPTLSGTDPNKPSDVNLFCSGHSLQADGSLFVVGGHIKDGWGANSACVYDPTTNTWTAKQEMNNGRWYPSALTLTDGSVLSIGGTYWKPPNEIVTNNIPQIWRANAWTDAPSPPGNYISNYPRLHLDPSGRVFHAGPQPQSRFLDARPGHISAWTSDGPTRSAGLREWAPSVMYDSGKVMYIGGGSLDNEEPTKQVEYINLNATNPKWEKWPATNMNFARRQHNATVLPNGSVLVTGGTRGPGFNDLSPGKPVHQAEIWNPVSKTWSVVAEESADRCYHSTALLIPDGRVISAGGGEYGPFPEDPLKPNPPKDSLKSAQFYSPSYLFTKSARPVISKPPPSEVDYGQKFDLTVGAADVITKVSLIRLGSVTHTVNMNQSFQWLTFQKQGSTVTVQAPANPNLAPPGHYMLFLLNNEDAPAIAPIIRIKPDANPAPVPPANVNMSARMASTPHTFSMALPELNQKIIAEQDRPHVVVGLTPVCIYGLGACWGGAHNALDGINDIQTVRPIPSQADSVAYVYLHEDKLPDIDIWRKEFENTANQSYHIRGIELTLSGLVRKKIIDAEEKLVLDGKSHRQELILEPFHEGSNIKFDWMLKAPKPVSEEETNAYTRLVAALGDLTTGLEVQVTGRIHKRDDNTFSLDVRSFEPKNVAST